MFALCTVLLREYEELLNDNRELHNHIEHQVDVFRPDFSDHLLFDSCKRSPIISNHLIFAFWVVTYQRFILEDPLAVNILLLWLFNAYDR